MKRNGSKSNMNVGQVNLSALYDCKRVTYTNQKIQDIS